MQKINVVGKLANDFTNKVEKEEFKVKGRSRIREGIFISLKEHNLNHKDIEIDGMSEGFIPTYAKEKTEFLNLKTQYPIDIYDENNNKVDIDTLGGVIPYGSEVVVAIKKSESSGYYYPHAIKVVNYNSDIVEENPFE